MKFITKNIVLFSIVAICVTIIFRYYLSKSLEHTNFLLLWTVVAIYGVTMFIIGWFFGKRDRQRLRLYDVGFRFHFVTYIICSLIAEIWVALNLNAPIEYPINTHITTAIWGLVILIHFGFYINAQKNSIKGVKRSDIFE